MPRTLWIGRPWILPTALGRSAAIIFVGGLVFWLEFLFGVEYYPIIATPTFLWTVLALFIAWIASIAKPLLLRASNSYVLREDGLEIRAGIITSKSFIIAPSGFSDLEVLRSISARLIGSGDIVIRTQGDNDVRIEKVRSPLKVASQIREVMASPLIRIGDSESLSEQRTYSPRALKKR